MAMGDYFTWMSEMSLWQKLLRAKLAMRETIESLAADLHKLGV